MQLFYRFIVICRYHAFQNKPLAATDARTTAGFHMSVEIEQNNPMGYNSLLVKAPPLDQIDQALHGTVGNIAAKPIGRVPKDLAPILRRFIQQYNAKVECFYLGNVLQKGRVKGGGSQLECFYVVELTPETADSFENDLATSYTGKFKWIK